MTYGGAGTGSFRRVKAIRQHTDIDITLISLSGTKDKATSFSSHLLNGNQFQEFWRNYGKVAMDPLKAMPGYCSDEAFAQAVEVDESIWIKSVSDADIIHLHWVNGLINYGNSYLSGCGKPIVWTFADLNAFTGGCHYSQGCTGFERGCERCPLLGGDQKIAHQTWSAKKRFMDSLSDLTIICPSRWLADKARSSSILKGRRIEVINNPNDPFFQPQAKILKKLKLGVPSGQTTMLVGAGSTANKRKGIDLLLQALSFLESDKNLVSKLTIIKYGRGDLKTKFHVIDAGFYSTQEDQIRIFSAADFYVFTSREENSPLVVQEALQVGTPVVGFDVGNVSDLITNMNCGFVVQEMSGSALAQGIKDYFDFCQTSSEQKRILQCVTRVKAFNDDKKSALAHEALYLSLFDKKKPEKANSIDDNQVVTSLPEPKGDLPRKAEPSPQTAAHQNGHKTALTSAQVKSKLIVNAKSVATINANSATGIRCWQLTDTMRQSLKSTLETAVTRPSPEEAKQLERYVTVMQALETQPDIVFLPVDDPWLTHRLLESVYHPDKIFVFLYQIEATSAQKSLHEEKQQNLVFNVHSLGLGKSINQISDQFVDAPTLSVLSVLPLGNNLEHIDTFLLLFEFFPIKGRLIWFDFNRNLYLQRKLLEWLDSDIQIRAHHKDSHIDIEKIAYSRTGKIPVRLGMAVPLYNNHESLVQLIQSLNLAKPRYHRLHVTLVLCLVDASEDPSLLEHAVSQINTDWINPFASHQLPTAFWAESIYHGLKYLASSFVDFVSIANADVAMSEDAISAMLNEVNSVSDSRAIITCAARSKHTKKAITVGALFDPSIPQVFRASDCRIFEKPENKYLTRMDLSCCFGYFTAITGKELMGDDSFLPDYRRLPHYWSDSEWTLRLNKVHGFRILMSKAVMVIVDDGDSSTGMHRANSDVSKRLLSRNSNDNLLDLSMAMFIFKQYFDEDKKFLAYLKTMFNRKLALISDASEA
jgi:glycosyltransferase involved in cell wall biosynthesis/GT2 family glycosyltransferase